MSAQRVVRDIRTNKDGLYFEIEGSVIQTAIREKINQSLESEIKSILEKLSPILEDAKRVSSCLAAFSTQTPPDDLSAEAAEVYVLSRRLDKLTNEVKTLTRIGKNLFSDDWYVCDEADLARFGV